MKLRRLVTSIGLLAVMISAPVASQTQTQSAGMGSSFNKRITARLGYFWSDADTRVRLDGAGGRIGTELNFEDDLGLQSSKGLSLASLSWRINLHHRIDASYVSLKRSGVRRLTADINFGDETYTIGADVNSIFESEIWRVAWGWSWFNNSKFEFGSLLGLHITSVKAGINTLDNIVSAEESTTVPLPVVGLQGTYAFTPKLHLRGDFQWFGLSYEEYDGSLFNASASLDYYAFDNFGIGLGYTLYDYDLTVDDDNRLEFDYRFSGPMAYLNLYF